MKNTLKTAAINTQHRLRLSGPVVGLTLLTLGLVACGSSTTSTPQTNTTAATPATSTGASANPDIALVPYQYDGTDHSWSAKSAGTLSTQAISDGNNALSAQNYSSATNGWGPVEINRSNGESRGGDGNTMTLNGKTYSTGLGVHSASEVNYDLNGQCTGFQTDMGVDDEVRSLGSVTFEIWADGTKLYDSGLMTGNSATKSASVDLTGKKQLKLVVNNGGDNLNYDHADWAGATLIGCKGSSTASGWTSIASEYQSFTLTASATVRYGAGTSWTQKTLDAGTYTCSNALFGDPASGYAKHCEVLSSNSGSVAPISATITYSGPLVITKGGTYSGNWESQDPNVPAVRVQTSDPVIIENSNIRGRGNLIAGFGNRITIQNTNGYGLNPNIAGRNVGKFANLEEVKNVIIKNNYIEGTSGIYIRSYTGNSTSSETIKIWGNKILNIDGRQSDGNGGFTANRNITQAVLFNQVQRIPGVEIAWNQVINEAGKSLTEETINMYVSSGTSASPMLIHDNYIQGAYNAQPWSDSSYAGGGILLGDGTTSNPSDSGHIRVYSNQIVNSSNQSLSIVGGVDNQIYNNRVVYSGRLPDGRIIAATTTGGVVWDISNQANYSPSTYGNNLMSNNYMAVTNLKSNGSVNYNSAMWSPTCNKGTVVCANNIDGGAATQDMEKQEYQSWLNKTAANGVKIGLN